MLLRLGPLRSVVGQPFQADQHGACLAGKPDVRRAAERVSQREFAGLVQAAAWGRQANRREFFNRLSRDFQISDGVPCRAEYMLPQWFLKTANVGQALA
jgi:hypothetical protein